MTSLVSSPSAVARAFLAAPAAVLVAALATGCPKQESEPTPDAGTTITINVLDENGAATSEVVADGVDFALVEVIVKRADDSPWSGEISLTTDRGSFASDPRSARYRVATDSNGRAAVEFYCVQPETGEPEAPGAANLLVDTGLSTAIATVSCVAAPDRRSLRLTSPNGTAFHADGFTEVQLIATAIGPDGQEEQGAPVKFEVSDGSQRLCTVDNSPCVPSALDTTLTVSTDANGEARVLVQAPSSPTTFDVTATWKYDASAPAKTATIHLNFAADASRVDLVASRNAVPANGVATVVLTATTKTFDGSRMPAGTYVTFNVSAPYTVGNPAATSTVAVVTGIAGQATTVLNASTTVGTAWVTASFDVAPGHTRSSEAATVSFAAPGFMLLTTDTTPPEFYTDDLAFSMLRVTVERDSAPVSGQQVVFSLSDLDLALAYLSVPGVGGSQQQRTVSTDSQGEASVEVRGQFRGAAGTVTVQVTTYDAQRMRDEWTAQQVLLKRHPILMNVVCEGAEPATLGTANSSRPSVAVVTFRAYDDNLAPMAGVEFRFPRPTNADPTLLVVTTGGGDTTTTDANGLAIAFLHAGMQAQPVRVVAEATDPRIGLVIVASSDDIPIISGNPSWTYSSFSCDQLHATISPFGERSCQIHLADRFSQRVLGGVSVQFLAESGNITASATTDEDGIIADVVFHGGQPAPADVRDSAGSLGTRNPLDRLVSLIAYTRGEEPFGDLNGNGAYDLGDPLIDLPEPLLDKQDNCVRNDATNPLDDYYIESTDPLARLVNTDTFLDGNNNGLWDGKNGLFEVDTLIWWQQWTLYTGQATAIDLVDLDCPTGAPVSDRCGPQGHLPWIGRGDVIRLRFRAQDAYGNCPSPGTSGRYRVEVSNGTGGGDFAIGVTGCGLDTGEIARDLNGNLQHYCVRHSDLVLDADLSIAADGVGAHPVDVAIDTSDSMTGVPIEITIKHVGEDEAGLPIETTRTARYAIPCTPAGDGGRDDCLAPRTCNLLTRVCGF